MKDATGKWVGWGIGDVDPKVADIQSFLARKFHATAGSLVATGTYDQATADTVAKLQRNVALTATGVFNYATQVALGYVKVAPPAPREPAVIGFSVEGHMSDMWHGPVADTLTILEAEGRVRHQPIGYENGSIPFNNQSGVDELARFYRADRLDNGVPFPRGKKSVLADFSQGGIVVYDFITQYLMPGQELAWRTPDILGRLSYGNPTRTTGSVAPWSIGQGGPVTNGGLDPLRRFGLPNNPGQSPFPQMDVYRKGDIFSDNEPNTGLISAAPAVSPIPAIPGLDLSWLTGAVSVIGGKSREGDVKSSVYQAVARGDIFSNPFSIVSTIANLFTYPLDEVWAIFQAIVSGLGFLVKQGDNPHYSPFNIDGGLNWLRGILP